MGWQDGFRSEGAAQSVQVAQFKLIKWTHNSDRLGMAIPSLMTRREFPRKSINFGIQALRIPETVSII